MTLVCTVVGVGGVVVFIIRGVQDGDDFFYWLATANAVFWLGMLIAILIVDNRRRRAVAGTSSESAR